MSFDLTNKRIWVAGHNGMVGSALVRQLAKLPCTILTAERSELDLLDQKQTEAWVKNNQPDTIIVAAAKVGGILANQTEPATFLYNNLVISSNIIHAAHLANVDRLLFLGSSCIYPKNTKTPIGENQLLTGPLEPTNQWYAIAKIAGVKMVEAYRQQYGRNYISAIPTNLYGPNDNFDLKTSHALPALIRKAHLAKTRSSPKLTIWGTGKPKREFLHVDDCANALIHILQNYDSDAPINIGTGTDISIRELAELVCECIGFTGEIENDLSKPDGTRRKCTNVDKLSALGWRPSIGLREGIQKTYNWFLKNNEVT